MGFQSGQNEAAAFQPAMSAAQGAQTAAAGTLAPPQTYQFNPTQVNQNASSLATTQYLQNLKSLQARSPQAAAGQESAINDLTGGVKGDDAFLQNAALKNGLEGAISQGTAGMGS